MKKSLRKNLLVFFLLFQGVIINFIFFPLLFIYSKLSNNNYLNLYEWVMSISFNLLAWQILYYLTNYVPNSEIKFNISEELKKYVVLIWVNRKLKYFFSKPIVRISTLNISIWFIIIFNLLIPLLAVFIFDFKIDFTVCCLWFISFQFVFFIFYYLNNYFKADTFSENDIMKSPWFLDSVFPNLIENKSSTN
jgi:hypothetical protein